MPSLSAAATGVAVPRLGAVRASLVSIRCFLRALPLFVSAAPGTPLRVLCIVALDTVRVVRDEPPLSRQRRDELAAFLDFQACTNAMWDGKGFCADEHRALRQQLETAGLHAWIEEYLGQLWELETGRPAIGGDHRRFDEARSYRESVARLSLAALVAMALDADSLEDGIQSTRLDGDVATLFRMAMQCQIVDDVVDYRKDLSAGLPSFLTATASLSQAIALTDRAVHSYAATRERRAAGVAFPLHVALSVMTAAAALVVAAARMAEGCAAVVRGPRRP